MIFTKEIIETHIDFFFAYSTTYETKKNIWINVKMYVKSKWLFQFRLIFFFFQSPTPTTASGPNKYEISISCDRKEEEKQIQEVTISLSLSLAMIEFIWHLTVLLDIRAHDSLVNSEYRESATIDRHDHIQNSNNNNL